MARSHREAWNLSWQVHIRCLDDGREGLKHKRQCGYRTELDLKTLVCTRGRDFPSHGSLSGCDARAADAEKFLLCSARRRTSV
jgi:hypothetical protein